MVDSKKIISLALLIAALGLAYYFIFALPRYNYEKILLEQQQQKAKEDQVKNENERKALNQANIDICIQNAEDSMSEHWDKLCLAKGLKKECLQPLEIVEIQDKRKTELKNECFKKYPLD